ncbi:histone-like nucleoid-structuring protein Lsr2 [Amycolatopsis methanolica]|uniref:histone-like nucleoid-structuring protein Lsr2 n=1 Tax=Amycolatopsis methanolica TaxID=1814 RepID=UPI003428AAFB
MAQKVTVELVDDLDGSVTEDISTVFFALDGVDYEIDLTADNAGRLRDELANFVANARKTGGRSKRGVRPSTNGHAASPADREKTRAIREWAKEQGYELADRGRIRADVVEAYEAAQASPAKPKVRKKAK